MRKEMGREEARKHIQVVLDAADLAQLPKVAQAGAKPMRLRRDAAAALAAMRTAAASEGLQLKVASAWRQRPWKTYEDYLAFLRKKYNGDVAKGKRLIGWDSLHYRGIAVDFGSDGLSPNSNTIAAQKKTKAHAWLLENASRFGFFPYSVEPWHWEFRPQGLAPEPPGADFTPGGRRNGAVVALVSLAALVFGGSMYWQFGREPSRAPVPAKRRLHTKTQRRLA